MSIIDTTTGHSPKSERKMARILYVSIGVAIVAILAMIFIIGPQNSSLSPFKSDDPTKEAPVESP